MKNFLFEKHTSVKCKLKKRYLEQEQHPQILIVTKFTIVNQCLDSTVVKYIVDIPKRVCNKIGTKLIQISIILTTDAYHDYILETIMQRD